MGPWNHTCFLSNLPVVVGDEVAVMILLDNKHNHEFSNPITHWTPAPFMFYGKYDDYGGVEECNGPMMDYLVSEIRENIVECSGESVGSTYIRGKVTRKGFGAAELFHADHEDKLKLVTPSGFRGALAGEKDPYLTATHTVVLQSVLDKVLDRYYWNEYMGSDVPNKKVNYEYLCELIPDYIKTLVTFFEEEAKSQFSLHFHQLPDYDRDARNYLANHVHAYDRQIKQFYQQSFSDKIKYLAVNEKFDELEVLLREFAKYIIMFMFIRDSRRCFIRPSTTSQETETTTQQMMANIVIEEGTELDKRFDEDWDHAWDPKREVYMTQKEMSF